MPIQITGKKQVAYGGHVSPVITRTAVTHITFFFFCCDFVRIHTDVSRSDQREVRVEAKGLLKVGAAVVISRTPRSPPPLPCQTWALARMLNGMAVQFGGDYLRIALCFYPV